MSSRERLHSGRQCVQSAQRGAQWLLRQQNADGSWRPLVEQSVDAFYKGSWALLLLGEAATAGRLLDYVQSHLLSGDGDFSPRRHPWHTEVHHLYANAYFAIGAQKLDRYRVSADGMRFILSQQDLTHGGFYSRKTAPGQRNRADTMSTGICGIACLATGHVEAAVKAAHYFERLIEVQPVPGARFYTTMEADGRLGTDFPAEETFWRVVDTSQKDQCWYAVGLPFSFAVLLHEATGDPGYAKLARWFFEYQSRYVNPWDGSSSGKAGWGCSLLYRITGEQKYRDIALQVAGNMVGWQTESGRFDMGGATVYGADGQPLLDGSAFDLTAEFVLWLGLIGANLLERDGG